MKKFYHDSKALGWKLQISHNPFVSQFPETWAQKNKRPNIEEWPENPGVMLELHFNISNVG